MKNLFSLEKTIKATTKKHKTIFILGVYIMKNVHGPQMANTIDKELNKKEIGVLEGFPGATA